MRPIGTMLPTVMLETENRSLSARSGLPASQPAISDREADIDIPRRVWSSWAPVGIEARSIVRPLSNGERGTLDRRKFELQDGLRPIEQCDRDKLIADSALSTMLGGFRSMRQRGDAVDAIVRVLLHLLGKFPAWAITKACEDIASGEAGLDQTWPPNDAQIVELVKAIVAPYQVLRVQAERLLSTPIEPPPRETVSRPDPTPEERMQAMALLIAQPEPPDPSPSAQSGYMQRVLADIEARKRAKESA